MFGYLSFSSSDLWYDKYYSGHEKCRVINPILSTTVDTTLVFLVTSILHCIKNHRSSHHQITGGGGLQIYGREQGCTGPGLNVSRGGEGVD